LCLHLIPPPPRSTLFPYTTLFRSLADVVKQAWSLTREAIQEMPAKSARATEAGSQSDSETEMSCAELARELSRGGEAFLLGYARSEEHTSELQSLTNLVCRLLLEK